MTTSGPADGVNSPLPLAVRVRTLAQSPFVALALRVATLLFTYWLLERWVFGIALLPGAAYEERFIILEVGKALISMPGFDLSDVLRVVGMLTLLYVGARRRAQVLVRWQELDEGRLLRWLAAAPLVVLAWTYATYDYNLYFGQAHLLDRFAVLALCALALWRPIFALPFVAVVSAIAWQFNHPIGSYSVTEQFLLVRALMLFLSYLLLRVLGARLRASDLVLVVITLLASSYFVPGLGKLRMGWFTMANVGLLVPATHTNGWLSFLDPAETARLTARLLALDPLLVAGTFVVECGAIFAIVKRRVLLFYLPTWTVFHLFVFAISGILFWKWIAFEAVIFALFVIERDRPALAIFTRPHAVLSILLVAGGTVWFQHVNLTWYNAAVNYTYRLEAITDGGRTVRLPASFFTPYNYQFTQTLFAYISPRRQLGVFWGAAYDRDVAEAMISAETPEEVEALEAARGQVFYDEARAEAFDDLVRRFAGNWNRRHSKRTVLSPLSAPPQLWTSGASAALREDESISRIVVHQITSFLDSAEYVEIERRELRSIAIPPA